MNSYLITLILTLAACFGIQSIALRSVGGRTMKSESNFFSSIARIQTGIRDNPKTMLLGSSMTGRLPDRNAGFTGVSGLGCDGGSAADALRAIDQGLLPKAQTLIIEGNTLLRARGGIESEIARAIRSPWFQVGRHYQLLGATARPSAFAYSKLLAKKIGFADGPNGPLLPVSTSAKIWQIADDLPADANQLVDELTAIIQRLKQQNTQVMIVILPPGADPDSLNLRIPHQLSRRASVPLLDLTKNLPQGAVQLTDSSHMAPASAAAALRTILAALTQHPSSP